MYRIFIVEDDITITEVLERQLRKWNYEVKSVKDFNNVINEFKEFEPHLILMDISLPFFNGYHWCEEIRKVSKTPIVFISSESGDMSLVMAINMGADDFITKPFSIEVALAKIQAVIRRTYDFLLKDTSTVAFSDVLLNLNNTTINYNGKSQELTKNEFKILQILFENKDSIVSRDKIIERLWDSESFIDDNTLTVNITRLRKKLEEIDLNDFIKTKKGLGYYLEKENEAI